MKAHFPKLVDVEEWKDSYTGKIHRSGTGAAAEPLAKSMQSSSSERRSLFLQGGADKPQRPDSEEMQAEIILPSRTGLTASKSLGARQFFGTSNFAQEGTNMPLLNTPFPEAPIRNAPVKVEALNAERELRNTGEGLKRSAQHGFEGKLKARDAAPQPSEHRDAREVSHSVQAEQIVNASHSRHDLVQSRAVQSYTPVEVQSKIDMQGSSKVAKDIVLDILMDTQSNLNSRGKQGSKEALQGLQDIALKMVMPISERDTKSINLLLPGSASGFTSKADTSKPNSTTQPRHLEMVKGAKGEQNFSEKEEKVFGGSSGKRSMEIFQKAGSSIKQNNKQEGLVADLTQHFLSSDVQKAALTSLTTNWKEDQEEQLRIGTWAVHVLSGQVDSIPTELLRGMKSDALKALGRLSMQLLAASTASATAESQPLLKGEVTAERSAQKYSGTQRAIESFENVSDQKQSLEIQRAVENISHLSKAAIKGSNEFFRMESVQADLQALQNNIQLDFTADVLVEGFIEALKYDNLEESTEMRSDILTSVLNASQVHSHSKTKSPQAVARTQQVTFDTESALAINSDKKRKFQIVHEESEGISLDTGGSVVQKQASKDTSKHSKDLGFEQTVQLEQEGHGGWMNIPQSKFIE